MKFSPDSIYIKQDKKNKKIETALLVIFPIFDFFSAERTIKTRLIRTLEKQYLKYLLKSNNNRL